MTMGELCAECRNWFTRGVIRGRFTVRNGELSPLDGIEPGTWIRIVGSIHNDGVYQYPHGEFTDEEFSGAVWILAIPPDFVALQKDIDAWEKDSAAALASLKLLLEKDWVGEVERKSKKIHDALISHPAVKEIRAAGLLIAVDLGDADKAKKVLYLLLDEGVLTDWFLFQPTSFRIAPPLCISDEEIDLGIEAVRRALDKL